MKKFSNYLLIFSLMFLMISCSKTKDSKPGSNSNDDSGSKSSLQVKLTANKWNMMANGESYGTMKFNTDGSLLKEQMGGGMESKGTWKLNGNILTISIPDEGEPFEGPVTVEGENLNVKFLDGAISYKFTPAG